MAHDASLTGAYGRSGLTDAQRVDLDQMERAAKPTDHMRGALVAMRVCAPNEADRTRLNALGLKWAQS